MRNRVVAGENARNARLPRADAVGDALGDQHLLGPMRGILVVEGVVADNLGDIRVPSGVGQKLCVFRAFPLVRVRALRGPGDEVHHLAALPVRKNQSITKEVVYAPPAAYHK